MGKQYFDDSEERRTEKRTNGGDWRVPPPYNLGPLLQIWAYFNTSMDK